MTSAAIFGYAGVGQVPGMSTSRDTIEAEVCWGRREQLRFQSALLDGATRDTGNTNNTNTLRPGLVLGKITATGKYTQYNPVATDGSQVAAAILMQAFRATDIAGSNQDLFVNILVGGPVKVTYLFGLDQQARNQMMSHFQFDDEVAASVPPMHKSIDAKAASYTVTAADAGKLFTTQGAAGAIIFTLPAPGTDMKGFRVEFFNEVDQNMTITGTAAKLVTFNNAAATSVALSTAGQKIGGGFLIVSNADGTKYLAIPRVAGHTVTVA